MQLSVNPSAIYGCLEKVEKALPVRTTIPAINNILLDIDSGNMNFTATNLEIEINAKMSCDSIESGKVLLPSKIVEIMRYIPDSQVNLEINFDNYRIDITGSSANFHLYGANPDDYPVSTAAGLITESSYKIKQNELKHILRSVIFATSTDETRPAFNGIYFSFIDNVMNLTASDTYRLVIKKAVDESWHFEERNCLVPARAMRELLRILGDGDEYVDYIVGSDMIEFMVDSIHFKSRLLQEKYPDVSGVIPKDYRSRIKIKRSLLEDCINRAMLLAEGKNQAVNIKISDQSFEISVSSQQGSMEEKIVVDKNGEDVEIYVNSRFILDVLKNVSENELIIDFHGDGGPIVIRLSESNDYIYLVLPIKKGN